VSAAALALDEAHRAYREALDTDGAGRAYQHLVETARRVQAEQQRDRTRSAR